MHGEFAEPDPFEEPYWNPLQSIAWVYLGDRAFVRNAVDGARGGTFWQRLALPEGRIEWVESEGPSPGLLTLATVAAEKRGAAYDTINDAISTLEAALRCGHIWVLGVKGDCGDAEQISADQWTPLEWAPEDGQISSLKYVRPQGPTPPVDQIYAAVDRPCRVLLPTVSSARAASAKSCAIGLSR